MSLTAFSNLDRTSISICLLSLLALTACSSAPDFDPLAEYEALDPATVLESPPPASQTDFPPERVEHGRYLVTLLGCGSCHTDGALVGEPRREHLLAGSRVGIGFSNPLANRNPGVVYPSNLTPDPETGIGDWNIAEITRMLRAGIDNHGSQVLSVMPWPGYAHLNEADATDIAMYLKSLPPVRHQVPDNVSPGRRATAPFVHFGVYRSRD